MIDLLKDADSGIATVLGNAFFREMSAEHFPHVLMRLQQIDVRAGETIFAPGQPAEYLYFVESGLCQLWCGDIERDLGTVGDGTCLGEEAAVVDASYQVGARAQVATRLIRLPAFVLQELVLATLPGNITQQDALDKIETGVLWLDVGEPDATVSSWSSYFNVALNELRVAPEKQLPAQGFVVSGDQPEDACLAGFILAVRGIPVTVLTASDSRSLRQRLFKADDVINIEPYRQVLDDEYSLEIDVRSLSNQEMDRIGEISQANADLRQQFAMLHAELDHARAHCERLDANMGILLERSNAALQQSPPVQEEMPVREETPLQEVVHAQEPEEDDLSEAVVEAVPEPVQPATQVLPATEASGPALVAAALLGGLVAWGAMFFFG